MNKKKITVNIEREGTPNYREIAKMLIRIDTELKAIGK